ncbi:MAG TPA: YqgQ family protein [Pseudogracilibacillus sp.]|nr:YqgQ family protein [Pseudogracilibacillus sp.]
MKTMLDVRNLLKRFGTFIYTGDRLGDAQLMIMEIEELKEQGLISQEEYLQAILLLRKEEARFRQ